MAPGPRDPRAGGERQLVVPDFVFTHADGTEVALEIVGYWTPEYLAEKLAKLAAVHGVDMLIAVPRRLALRPGILPEGALVFKHRLLLPCSATCCPVWRRSARPAALARSGPP